MQCLLSEIATIKAGYPFRGKVPEVTGANTRVVQIKDINKQGEIKWAQLITTELSGRKTPDWLQEGDILFAARGQRNLAVHIDQVPVHTVCGVHFFIIQAKQSSNILPEFLAWQLNQFPAQKYIAQSAEGSAQLSIRRGVLEAIPLVIPSLKKQQSIVKLFKTVKQENKALQALIENRTQQMQCIAQKILLNNQ